jgi:deoxycytidylate deaminase
MANGHLPHVQATLLKKGKPLLTKRNSLKTHPLLKQHTKYPYLHAESAVIFALGIDKCSNLDLYVQRFRRDGRISMAKPCKTCMKIIKQANIRRIYYTNWSGDIIQLKVI